MQYQFIVHQKDDGKEYLKLYFGQAVAEHENFKGLTGEYQIVERHGDVLIGLKEEAVGKGKAKKTFTYQVSFDVKSGQVLDRQLLFGTAKENNVSITAFFEKTAMRTNIEEFSPTVKLVEKTKEIDELNKRLLTAVKKGRLTKKQADKKLNDFISKKNSEFSKILEISNAL